MQPAAVRAMEDDEALGMQIDRTESVTEAPRVQLSNPDAQQALLEDTPARFHDDWHVVEQLYPPPGSEHETTSLTCVVLCTPHASSASHARWGTAPRAAKLVRQKLSELHPVTRQRLARELEILNALDSPFLVPRPESVYVNDERVFIVMPLMAGNLHQVLAARHERVERFTDEEVCTVARRLLLALVYLHDELGVVHRDIKPLNVLLRVENDLSSSILADVGHSRALSTGQVTSSTIAGLGTDGFRPPELQRGLTCSQPQPHTRRVDMFQLGATLYLMLMCIGPGRITQGRAVARNSFFTVPEWAALAAADGARGAARRNFLERIMHLDDPAARGRAREALAHEWVAGAPAGV